ncbi:MAG: DEAD/DEAH box helicase [Ferrovum sp.]|nr:DEAD/DEAH box helicase [Ferrovum sp.]
MDTILHAPDHAVIVQEAPDSAGKLLRLISLAYLPLTRTQAGQLWEHFGAAEEGPLDDSASLIDHLLERGDLLVHNGRLTCHSNLSEVILRSLANDTDGARYIDTVRLIFKTADYRYGYFVRQFNEGVRDLRLALYGRKFEDFSRLAQTLQNYFSAEWRSKNPFLALFDAPFSADQFDSLPYETALTVAATILTLRTARLELCKGPLSWLRERARHAPEEQRAWFASVLCEPMILRGHLEEALALVRQRSFPQALTVEALITALKGQWETALPMFDGVLKECRKPQDLRKSGMSGLGGILYVITLIAGGEMKALERASQHIAQVIKNGANLSPIFACLGQVARATQTVLPDAVDERAEISDKESLGLLFRALACWWVDGDGERIDGVKLQELARRADNHGYRWIAAEAWELLGRMNLMGGAHHAAHLHQELGSRSLVDAIRRQPLWERALGALERLGEEVSEHAAPLKQHRFYWILYRSSETQEWLIEGREQKRNSQGQWSSSKGVTLQRMIAAQQEMEGLTHQDLEVIAWLRSALADKKPLEKRFDAAEVLPLLVGHPQVFWPHDTHHPIELCPGRFVLQIERARHQWHLSLLPPVATTATLVIQQESCYRVRIYTLTEQEIKLRDILGDEGQNFPLSIESRLQALQQHLSTHCLIHAPDGGGNLSLSPAQEGLYALLSPHPLGLQIAVVTYPMGENQPSFTPGAGHPIHLMEDSEGEQVQGVWRNLSAEHSAAKAIFNDCRPWLKTLDDTFVGTTLHPAAACEILALLKSMGEEQIRLRWPVGETLKIRGEAQNDHIQLNVTAQGEWLQVSGGIKVDEHTVLEMKTLLEAAKHPDRRFVALSDGQYLALSAKLMTRIQSLASLTQNHGENLQIPALAAPRLAELIKDGGETTTDEHWTRILTRHASLTQWEPQIPSGINAELRDYQYTGFVWMVRHAEAGAGACLADDMGLGKTLQTLTLLLYRAPLGPALVVAPTSVCGNWIMEAQRFAPSLKLHWLSTGGRDQLPKILGPEDLVVMSYTLFQQEADHLNQHPWATFVLDEAQAIKNSGTKRSQAAMKLKAGFRLITTGTPIENHLGELWNLFRFINPGLLGSLDSFTEKFAHPIERNGDPDARERLRKLIQPFILRRTKSQVLTELPQRTEVTLRLEASTDECAMYEAVRLEALEKVTPEGEAQPNRIRVLAGIMKLRRACCHGALILPEREWISTKIHALMEIVEELKDSGHRALVFSEFVDYLTLIRKSLDESRITYQYLDGSTPVIERSKRVKVFQEGTDDLFLISLKAGGVGLNLTAADYVIHMDPWWNPAVEDQASDRAHRIGQTRPVTVYRLIIKNSIEEKIVALHERKRNLADSLLEGAGEATTLSTEELLGLLQYQP